MSETKVLIIAAGLGSRMGELTQDTPKCMVDFHGKTLLQRQLDAYADAGLNEIGLVRGYKKEKIDYTGITYFENDEYQFNNILCSMFFAEDYIQGDIVVGYSDILFESDIVSKLLKTDHDIAIVVDTDWQDYYVGRVDHPISEAENVIFDEDLNVKKIGKHLGEADQVSGEFIGMLKLSPKGAEIFKQHFNLAKQKYWNKPFQKAASFRVAYITDMVQELVDLGVPVGCVTIERGWKEIDTLEDHAKAVAALSSQERTRIPDNGK